MPPLLDVRNLQTQFHTRYGVVQAVQGVSFTLQRGETLGMVGESGCGKSVTALSVMRLLPEPAGHVAGGQVLFDGANLLDLPTRAMRGIRGNRIAMIFQDPMTALNPVLTIGRQMSEPLQLHLKLTRRQARQRALELLQQVGIPAPERRLQSYPHQLSGGMRQRVMLAIAISCNPDIVIADEPTTALDVTIQAQILDLLNRLKRDLGMALLLITHNLGVVAGMSERVLVMYAGRIVEAGATADVFANPRMPYTIGLLRSTPRLDAPHHLEPVPGMPPSLLEPPAGCPFSPRCAYVQPACQQQNPPLRLVEAGHRAACLFDITRETPPSQG
jgi:oligopeptide transport system ATP-binding protein